MEIVYSIEPEIDTQSKDWVVEEKNCMNLSCKNILAFCKRCTDKQKQPESQRVRKEKQFNVIYKIFVFDLDKPWNWFKVLESYNTISHIEWNRTGTRLLVVDSDGLCQIWQMEDSLLNTWNLLGSSSVSGEEVLAVTWLHSGVQILFNPEKRDSILYTEKFHRSKFSPSLTHYGGKSMDGFILVTASGLVSVGIIHDTEPFIETVQKNLSQSHLRLSLADIAHTGSGDIMIAVSDGLLNTAIQCYLVTLTMQQDVLTIECNDSASLYLKNQMTYAASEIQQLRMTNVQFLNSENSDMLLLCCGGQGYSSLEIWHLIDQHMPINPMFQMNSSQEATFQIPKWMHKTTVTHTSFLTSVAGPKLPMSKNLVETGFMPYIGVSYRDGTVKLIHRHTHQVFHTATDALQSKQGQSPPKKLKPGCSISSLLQTGSGCGLMAMNDGKIFLLKVYNARDGNVPLHVPFICLLLEHSMIAGFDYWDILLSIKQGMIETLSQRLTDNYYKQAPPMQEVTGMRLLSLKMALYCSSTVSHQKAVDFHARLVLQAVIGVFRSLLRPKSVSIQDKSPAEKLTLLCSKMTDGDLENMLMSLELEEFLIDSRKKDKSTGSENALPSLQPLIQWIADFCLHLLASIPLYQSYSNFPGSSLLSDPSVLNTLRELLVIIRIWGVINKSCLPVFTMAANVDCLAHLFKVMTKAWLCCKDGGNLDYDDTLLDECCVLPSKILVPSTNQSFRLDSASYTIFTQQCQHAFVEGEEPEYLYEYRKLSKNLLLSDVLMDNRQHHDIIRQVHLGSKPSENVRQCSRCGGYSLLQSLAKSPIMKAWEQRWGKSCLCGGHWKLATTSDE